MEEAIYLQMKADALNAGCPASADP
ncbi:hypothetical protein AvCA_28300 [Azotobacter vinelandii CA]|uniref:Uncharacterized protein n=2 Tax=Azotobacter vinelandii TaxID=354 RepID=C1DL00_AZOVD|nr:hypothetical protein Avin_28300 [Azotobacter vinelandii DJ]AGK16537.1 hypothetical protein AvCA_28300 [Azotobacter vinelandii CA]AGK20896.1 hypothetical protein AvCA6_28300 [Azotobacter vinelandii CA6]